ncbi:MAG TPA: rhomboid family intramembrane serine protease [Pseudomonas xinjiangensis]|uniref:Rhomboid family intramembrane serine protease n=2 Tax=root TaxID=1 RepID=A0A7V1FTD2_9GAMM|nr:rhomboid family intramembrane serine protease [Halopseudomonas xinjiangensis]HEC46180.1 rhomboid family intramembrane serine protease [Halopseudomonas xinjiangensis]
MYRAMNCPLDEDLSKLARFLRSHGVVHRITEEGGRQVVWTVDESDAQVVQNIYAEGVPEVVDDRSAAARSGSGWQTRLRQVPVTLAVLVLTGLAAVYTGLGSRPEAIVDFTFTPLAPNGFLAPEIDMSQWWRLVTPIFLHFSLMHVAFNALWFWELGRRIELRSGGLWLLGLIVLFALSSNTAQWLASGNGLFGGMSGVVYGLLGYCWLYQWVAPNVHFELPKGVVILMLVWLLLGVSGLITLLGLGAIANAAHIGGLVAGCIVGAVAGALQRNR